LLVASDTNDGFAQGNNKAVSHLLSDIRQDGNSGGVFRQLIARDGSKANIGVDYLLFINNDTRVTKGMVRQLVTRFQTTQDAGFIVPKIYFEKGHEFHAESYSKAQTGHVIWYAGGDIDWDNLILSHRGVDEVDRGQFDGLSSMNPFFSIVHDAYDERDVEFATGCCFLTTPSIWQKLKGFDPAYFLYYEDADLSIRLQKKLNKRIVVEPKAMLYHQNAGSTKGSGSSIHQYYQTRNRLRFGLQYASRRTKLALLLEARRHFLHGSGAVKLGILDALGGKWGNQSERIPVEKH
jgi:GT2 family glycosyltransferase